MAYDAFEAEYGSEDDDDKKTAKEKLAKQDLYFQEVIIPAQVFIIKMLVTYQTILGKMPFSEALKEQLLMDYHIVVLNNAADNVVIEVEKEDDDDDKENW